MAGLMTLGKELRAGAGGNVEYLEKGWQALCATQNIENIFQVHKTTININAMVPSLIEWQGWIKRRQDLRMRFLDYVVGGLERDTDAILMAALDQVRMVLREFGLKSVLLMESFISSHNRALELAPIAQQAVDLKKALKRQREVHKDKFAYVKIYPLKGSDTLHHRNYPDLYYAAIRNALDDKELEGKGRYIMTGVQTSLPETQIKISRLLKQTRWWGSSVATDNNRLKSTPSKQPLRNGATRRNSYRVDGKR